MVSAMTLLFVKLAYLLVCLLVAQHSEKTKRTGQKRKKIYSTSQINSIIDATVHPLADQHWFFVAADGLLHAVNESEADPIETLLKFLKYNMPELLRRLMKQLRESNQE